MSHSMKLPAGIQPTHTILDKIIARKVEELATLGTPSGSRLSPVRDFAGALRQTVSNGKIALIAEVKHASPSKGVLVQDFDPVRLGTSYAQHGASAISVLTDQDFFQGSLGDLQAVRTAVAVPILCKDFTIDPRQVEQAYYAGADAILLIVAVLDDGRLRDLFQTAYTMGLAALIEVHNEAEMERALRLDPPLLGINNRDLHTFTVDLAVTQRLASNAPSTSTIVSESGIFTPDEVERVAQAGVHAILVGESLVKAGDVAKQIRLLSNVPYDHIGRIKGSKE